VGKEKHWGFTSGFMNEIITFTPDEIAILEGIKDGLQTEINKKTLDGVISKLRALSRKQITKVDDAIELIMKSEGMAVTQKPSYKIDIETVDIIRQAIKQNKMISGKYLGNDKVLAPYGIIYSANVYLIGVEEGKPDPYVYSLHRLSEVKLTEKTFDKGYFDIKEYANRSFGVYQNEVRKVELLFSPQVKEDVLHYSFHPTQKVKENDVEKYYVWAETKVNRTVTEYSCWPGMPEFTNHVKKPEFGSIEVSKQVLRNGKASNEDTSYKVMLFGSGDSTGSYWYEDSYANMTMTSSLGRKPLKSVGWTATMPGAIVLETRSSASPETGMVRPLFKTMVCDMYETLYKNQ
jgi:predicted DNA-binding transcriptional regulator YafY